MRTRPSDLTRRACLLGVASTASLWLAGCAASATTANGAAPSTPGDHEEEADVTPGEDLMQEHGVLERILLIYDEAASRIERA